MSPNPVILLTFLYKHVSFILNSCTWYLLPSSMLLITQHIARMAKWSKAPVLVTSHFAGVGSSPTPFILLTFLYKVLSPLFETPAHVFSTIITTIDIPIQSSVSFILNTGTWYLLPSSMLLTTKHRGRMAEWSNALNLSH